VSPLRSKYRDWAERLGLLPAFFFLQAASVDNCGYQFGEYQADSGLMMVLPVSESGP
jgi:hypothetical protein